MSVAVIGRRLWRSFLGVRPATLTSTGERGRAGYGLGQRLWASFIGVDLPPVRVVASPGRVSPAAPRRTPRRREPGWFALPPLTAGGLSAAGEDAVVLEAASPDGGTTFLVRRQGIVRPAYSLEVVMSGVDAARPLMSTVTYTRADGGEQVLLVPVAPARFGPPASYVHLPGFAAETSSATWSASGPVPVDQNADWDAATVAASVRAARNEATRAAWRRVRDLVGERLRDVIDGEPA